MSRELMERVVENLIEKRWKYTLDFLPEYEQARDGEIAIDALVAVVIYRIQKMIKDLEMDESTTADLEDIISEFEMTGTDEDQFDSAMEMLYDWADDNNVWVNTF